MNKNKTDKWFDSAENRAGEVAQKGRDDDTIQELSEKCTQLERENRLKTVYIVLSFAICLSLTLGLNGSILGAASFVFFLYYAIKIIVRESGIEVLLVDLSGVSDFFVKILKAWKGKQ